MQPAAPGPVGTRRALPGPAGAFLSAADKASRFVSAVGVGVAALGLLASLFIMSYAVFMRYVLVKPQAWTDEFVGYLLVATVAGAVSYALRHREHIAVDILTERLGPLGQRVTEVAGLIAVAIVAGLLTYESYETAAFSKMIGLRSNGELATAIYLPQYLLVFGFGLLLFTALVGLVRRLAGLSAFSESDEVVAPKDDEIVFTKKTGIE